MKKTGLTTVNLQRTTIEGHKSHDHLIKNCYLKGKKPGKKTIKNKNTKEPPNRNAIKPNPHKNKPAQEYRQSFDENKKQRPTYPTLSPTRVKNKQSKRKLTQTVDDRNQYHLNVTKTHKKSKQKSVTPYRQRKVSPQPNLQQLKQQIKQQNNTEQMKKLMKNTFSNQRLRTDVRLGHSVEHNKTLLHSPKVRYAKFQLRSEKYSKIFQELKTSGRLETGSQKPISQKTNLPKSYYKTKVSKLQKQIDNYRSLSTKSQTALRNIESIKRREQKEFNKKVQGYLQQIKRLEEQLREYRPNIGHLYSYKDYTNQKLVPEDVIVEECQESKFKQPKTPQEMKKQSIALMQYYLNRNTEEQFASSVEELSITSNSN